VPDAAEEEPSRRPAGTGRSPKQAAMTTLVIAALGVVFGDIGTSPLYSLQTVFSLDHNKVQATPGDVYVSIVPFVKDVNVGASNYNANWIDWSDWDNNNGTCRNYWGWTQPQTKSSCLSASGSWSRDSHSTWNGCVVDRGNSSGPDANNYDTNVVAPTP